MNEMIENKRPSEVLCEKILQLNYGELITHDEISSIIKEEYGSPRYSTVIQQTKTHLLKKQRAIESIRGQGYRVVEPDAFVDLSLDHYKKGFKEMQKGSDTLRFAPAKDMSIEGRNTYHRVQDRANALQAVLNGASVELKELRAKEGIRNHPMAIENIKA